MRAFFFVRKKEEIEERVPYVATQMRITDWYAGMSENLSENVPFVSALIVRGA